MRTLVDIPAAHLRCALEAGGWCVELVDEPDYWWCRQRWRLRSTRAPLDFEAYIAFLVDAEHRKDVERIWALKASPHIATRWQSGAEEHLLQFRNGWRKDIPAVLGYLDGLRG
jgi:hypothetical protein